MGYSGNSEPSFICPTAIATAEEAGIGGGAGGSGAGIGDLDFYTGDEALSHSRSYSLSYPIRGGLIESWSGMEKLWQRCFYDYLRVEPEEHFVLLVSCASKGKQRMKASQFLVIVVVVSSFFS